MYNLGFLALKNNVIGNKLVQWWKIRLKDRCFQNMMENYFTDQKWIDFIPSFFPNETLITNNLGLNVAPWNFHERKVEKIENTYFVKNRITNSQVLYPLIFIHFSGYNYGALISEQNEIEKKGKSIFYQEINEVIDFYSTKLKQANISQYLGLSYKYSCFENGISISKIHRKLYRRLIEDGNISGNPFDVKGDFYHSLKRNGLTSKLIVESDKVGVNNVNNLESKTIVINKVFRILFKVIGSKRYFLLVRLMRLYSKPENHVYLIDKNYLKRFKIWS
jgi:hypothetical protein